MHGLRSTAHGSDVSCPRVAAALTRARSNDDAPQWTNPLARTLTKARKQKHAHKPIHEASHLPQCRSRSELLLLYRTSEFLGRRKESSSANLREFETKWMKISPFDSRDDIACLTHYFAARARACARGAPARSLPVLSKTDGSCGAADPLNPKT
jgi:hypothetical protein